MDMQDNFKFKKSLGQNFINDPKLIDKIVDSALIDKDTLVVEIGPGAGALSVRIVSKAGFTLLYEVDERLELYLLKLLKDYDNKKVIISDFLGVDVDKEISKYDYDKFYVVANLPYYITTAIITKILDMKRKPDKLVVMVQKEVADRLEAKPGSRDYGAISVYLSYFYDVKKLFDVDRNYFTPEPKVDSAVVLMERKNNIDEIDQKLFLEVIRIAFQFKRKNLRNNFKKFDLNMIAQTLDKYGYSLNDRAEDLPLDVFIELTKNWK